jgi:2-aminophenol/2-amino-5-chlorophenol 1,6-dioxygenase alpha subunit
MKAVRAAALVPGLPHLLAAQQAPGWGRLAEAMRRLGDELRSLGVESLVITSSQWISVLGLQIQMRPEVTGTRVDENWYRYDYGTLDYQFRTDLEVSERWLALLRSEGFQARPTNHPHFPVDTGVVVATRLLDPEGRFRIAQASLHLYGSAASVEGVGAAAARAVEGEGRPAALIAIGGLSSHPLRTWIDPLQDAIASAADDAANQRVLEMLRTGDADALFSQREAISRAAAMDGQLRTLAFLHGGADIGRPARVHAYAPVWGMGAAVVSWSPADKDELQRSEP